MSRDDVLTTSQVHQLKRRQSRWYLLRTIYMSRPIGVNETILYGVMTKTSLCLSHQAVRNELEYLAQLGLITLAQGGTWLAEITPAGVDVVEYTTEAPAGILRPEQQD